MSQITRKKGKVKAPKSNKRVVISEAIVKDSKGKVLLLKRSRANSIYIGKWQFPGGKAEVGENARQAITREIFEETGCKCFSLKLLKKVIFSEIFRGRRTTVELNTFSCKLKGKIVLSKDHSKYKFVKASKSIEKILAPISKKALFE
ncbi:MAG: NUDIX domain-containing protein [archaeon]